MMSTFTVIFVQIFFLSYALEEFEKSISIQLFLYKGFKKKLNKVKKNKKKKKNLEKKNSRELLHTIKQMAAFLS